MFCKLPHFSGGDLLRVTFEYYKASQPSLHQGKVYCRVSTSAPSRYNPPPPNKARSRTTIHVHPRLPWGSSPPYASSSLRPTATPPNLLPWINPNKTSACSQHIQLYMFTPRTGYNNTPLPPTRCCLSYACGRTFLSAFLLLKTISSYTIRSTRRSISDKG